MRVAEIITELPKLKPGRPADGPSKAAGDRRRNSETLSCGGAALEGAQMFDRLEAEDDAR